MVFVLENKYLGGTDLESSGKWGIILTMRDKRIWIDLENSPHVPFFKPIIPELEKRGYSVLLTARDCFQVCGLADRHNFRYIRVGRHYGKNRLMKLAGLMIRATQMIPIAIREKPQLAVAHGSRSQTIVSNILGIPMVTIGDYEHGRRLPFTRSHCVIVPEVIPDSAITWFRDTELFKYPGIKEDVYVPSFRPEPGILEELGISEKDLVVTIRPPASEAHYHNPKSDELFNATVEWLAGVEGVRMVMLPRNDNQADFIRKKWPVLTGKGKMVIPGTVVDGLNLIWHSDLVISGGGTMNREAAALGVPVYSIFRGEIGAVDRYLADNGRLVLLEKPEDLALKVPLKKWSRPALPDRQNSPALESIVGKILELMDCVQACSGKKQAV